MQDPVLDSPRAQHGHALVHRAILFATEAHLGQTRKITDTPYIWHPLAVGRHLSELDCPPEVVAAGILHDVVEDTSATLDDVVQGFGNEVAELVDLCSEPTDGWRWEDRKRYIIQRMRKAPFGARMILSVDKLDNLASIDQGLKTLGEETWTRFKRGPEAQEWYYRSMAAAVRGLHIDEHDPHTPQQHEPGFDHPVFDELDQRIESIFGRK